MDIPNVHTCVLKGVSESHMSQCQYVLNVYVSLMTDARVSLLSMSRQYISQILNTQMYDKCPCVHTINAFDVQVYNLGQFAPLMSTCVHNINMCPNVNICRKCKYVSPVPRSNYST